MNRLHDVTVNRFIFCQIPDHVFDETATASFNSSDTLTAWGDEDEETDSVTEIAGIWNDNVGEANILTIQLPEKKGGKRGTKRKSSDDNDSQGKTKRCRAHYGLDQKEEWCKPCRMKKKGVTCTRLS